MANQEKILNLDEFVCISLLDYTIVEGTLIEDDSWLYAINR